VTLSFGTAIDAAVSMLETDICVTAFVLSRSLMSRFCLWPERPEHDDGDDDDDDNPEFAALLLECLAEGCR